MLGHSTGKERLKTEHKPHTQLHVETHAIQVAGKGMVFEVWSDTIGVDIGVVLPTNRHGVIQVDTGRHRSVCSLQTLDFIKSAFNIFKIISLQN